MTRQLMVGSPRFTASLCKLLHLDPNRCRKMTIEIAPAAPMVITVEYYLGVGTMDEWYSDQIERLQFEVKEISHASETSL